MVINRPIGTSELGPGKALAGYLVSGESPYMNAGGLTTNGILCSVM